MRRSEDDFLDGEIGVYFGSAGFSDRAREASLRVAGFVADILGSTTLSTIFISNKENRDLLRKYTPNVERNPVALSDLQSLIKQRAEEQAIPKALASFDARGIWVTTVEEGAELRVIPPNSHSPTFTLLPAIPYALWDLFAERLEQTNSALTPPPIGASAPLIYGRREFTKDICDTGVFA